MRNQSSGRSVILFGLSVCAMRLAFAGPNPRLFVVNSLSEDLTIIDTTTDTVTGRIPIGARGYRIAFAPGGDKAYVTCSSGAMFQDAKMKLGESGQVSQLVIVDLGRQQVEGRIPMDISAVANIHIHPTGRRAFVVTAAEAGRRNLERGRVLFVDLVAHRDTNVVNVGLNPLDSVMTLDGKKLFTADWGSRSISIVDLETERLQDTISLGVSPARVLAVSPDGRKVYIVQERQPVSVPDVTLPANSQRPYQPSQQVLRQPQSIRFDESLLWEIAVDSGRTTASPFDGLSPVYALAVAPDGKRLYAYGRLTSPFNRNATVAVLPRSNDQLTTMQAGTPVMQGMSSEVYDLIVLDLDSKRILQHFGNFGFLSSMSLDSEGNRIYLIGTPGNPTLEARVQTRNFALQQRMGTQTVRVFRAPNNAASEGMALDKARAAQQAMDHRSSSPLTVGVSGLIRDLSHLPKTVTVLDVKTGRRLKTLTIGSLPQGCGLLVR